MMRTQTKSRLRARESSRVDIKGILADPAKRRVLFAGTIRFLRQVEGGDMTLEEALSTYDRAARKSPYKALDKAYRAGRKAGRAGKGRKNPYPAGTGSRGQTEHGAWERGWLCGRRSSSS